VIPDDQSGHHDLGWRAPENVAPAVAYLASDRSDWCNGQVLLSGGYHIGLYDQPHLVSRISNLGSWHLPKAFDLIEEAFSRNVGLVGPEALPPVMLAH
jgi:hypothetical protein